MIFRTEIEIPRDSGLQITHDTDIVLLGSCFTDNIGEKLCADGFNAEHNPFGALYNAVSILNALKLTLKPDTHKPHYVEYDGVWHCVDFATKFSSVDKSQLVATVENALNEFSHKLAQSDVIFITLGTAFVFSYNNLIVGNCHKLPSSWFNRQMLSTREVADALNSICQMLPDKKVVFTISPIRHTADTLHGNQLSKSTLLLAVNDVVKNTDAFYFPAYEIMIDDLRDYRFYATDMKHPSESAVDYIYEIFGCYYFDNSTNEQARRCRKMHKRSAHKPIIENATTCKQNS